VTVIDNTLPQGARGLDHCVECQALLKVMSSQRKPHKQLSAIGASVREGGYRGGSTHSFFQCSWCGSLWAESEDWGLGATATFLSIIKSWPLG
jgi:hypothetical protein